MRLLLLCELCVLMGFVRAVCTAAGAALEDPSMAGREFGLRLPQVHTVTADEAHAAAYSIDDVVLPLPGSRIRYPAHATAQVPRVGEPLLCTWHQHT